MAAANIIDFFLNICATSHFMRYTIDLMTLVESKRSICVLIEELLRLVIETRLSISPLREQEMSSIDNKYIVQNSCSI